MHRSSRALQLQSPWRKLSELTIVAASAGFAGCSVEALPPDAFVTRASAPPAALPMVIEEERAVLTALLELACTDWLSEHSAPVTVVKQTDPRLSADDAVFTARPDPPSGWEDAASRKRIDCPVPLSMGQALRAASKTVLPLVDGVGTACGVRLVSRDDLAAWVHSGGPQVPVGGVFHFSPVVFDAAFQSALVVKGWYGGALAGRTTLCFLRKSQGVWAVAAAMRLQVS